MVEGWADKLCQGVAMNFHREHAFFSTMKMTLNVEDNPRLVESLI